MITIKSISNKEIEKLKKFLLTEKLPLSKEKLNEGNIYIGIYERDYIVGVTRVLELSNESAVITCIYISSKNRNEGLGDALLKSTIHNLLSKGFNKIIVESNEEAEVFLSERKIGLTEFTEDVDYKSKNKLFLCNPSILLKSNCRV